MSPVVKVKTVFKKKKGTWIRSEEEGSDRPHPDTSLTTTTMCVIVFSDKILIIQAVLSNVDNASINCPGMEVNKENVHITLHKETELHFTDFQNNQVTNTSQETQRYRVDVKNDIVDYVIDMPQVSDTGLYNCTIAHGHVTRTTQTFLLVKGIVSSCPSRSQ